MRTPTSVISNTWWKPSKRRRARLALPVAALLALSLSVTGCGSTVLQGTTAAGTTDMTATGDGLGGPGTVEGSPGELGSDGSLGADGLALDGSTSTGPGATGVGGATGVPATTGVPGTSVVPGTPVGHDSAPGSGPLKVGIAATNTAAIAAAFGQENSDAMAIPKKFVESINKSGGIGGREIVPTYFEADSADNASTNGQRACAAFTQDAKVEVVINAGMLGGDVLPACLKAAGIALIETGSWFADRTVAQQFPNWIMPSAMRADRVAGAQIQQAIARGILKEGDKLGVLVEDCPWGHRVADSTVKPMASDAGVEVTEGTFKCVVNIVSDLGPVSNDVQRETLRFHQEGVTHVLIISAAEAFVFANFTDNASQQKYFPKYLITSLAYPWNNSRSNAIVSISPDALPNIYGFGTLPVMDIGTDKAVNANQAAAQKRCTNVDPTKGGADSLDANDRPFRYAVFYGICETFMTLKTVLESNGSRTAYPDVVAGFRTMMSKGVGNSLLVAGGYSGGAADRTDGAGAIRPFAYDTNSKTWRYTGNPTRVP